MVASVLVFRLWLRLLPRSVCPACGEPTLSVSHPLALGVGRWLSRRWCAACDWGGWGRRGPVLWPRKSPVADGSGFRWGEDRLQPNFGFQWRERRSAKRLVRTHHPSGFRFAGSPAETLTVAEATAHPSGFCFRETSPEAMPAGDRPSGFSWGRTEPPPKPGFRSKS